MLSPSLAGYPQADREIESIAADMWGDLDGITATQRVYGKGRVVWGVPLDDVLTALHAPKDVEHSRDLDTDLAWIHRRAGDTDIYFVANRTDRPLSSSTAPPAPARPPPPPMLRLTDGPLLILPATLNPPLPPLPPMLWASRP